MCAFMIVNNLCENEYCLHPWLGFEPQKFLVHNYQENNRYFQKSLSFYCFGSEIKNIYHKIEPLKCKLHTKSCCGS